MGQFARSVFGGGVGVARRIDWHVVVIAGWGLLLLYPIRQTGWIGDDMFNASLPGLWIYRAISPLADAWSEIRPWMHGGRINPGIHLWKEASFWLFHDLYWYKWAQLGAVIGSLLVFYGCLRGMDADADFAALCCLLVAALIQFRGGNDPVLAYNFLLPMVLSATAVSVLLLHRFRVGGSRLALAGSLLLFAVVALTYEMTYPFWILHAWVLLRTRAGWKRRPSPAAVPGSARPVDARLLVPAPPACRPRRFRIRLGLTSAGWRTRSPSNWSRACPAPSPGWIATPRWRECSRGRPWAIT